MFSRGNELAIHAGVAAVHRAQRLPGRRLLPPARPQHHLRPHGILLQQLKIYGNEFLVAGAYDWHGSSPWRYGPRADLRLIAGNEFGFGSTKLLGIGAQVARKLSEHVHVNLTLKYYTGTTHAGAIDLTGYQAWIAAGGTF